MFLVKIQGFLLYVLSHACIHTYIHVVLKCSIQMDHVLMTCTDVYNVGKCFSVQAIVFYGCYLYII